MPVLTSPGTPAMTRAPRSGRRLYAMRGCDALASATATYTLPLLVLVTTLSTSLTGLAFALEWTPRLAAFTVAGSAVDRWGGAAVFRAANAIRCLLVAVAAVTLTALPAGGTAATATVMTLGGTIGALSQVSFVAVETLGAQASRRLGDQAHRVQSVQTGIDQGALLTGPLLGGVLLAAGPAVMLTAVALLAAAAAAIATPADRAAQSTRHGRDEPAARGLAAGWRTLRGIPALAWLVCGLAASNLASGVLQAAAPIMVVRQFGYPTPDVGAVWSTAAVLSLLAIAAARRAIDRWRVWPVGAAATAVSTAACAATAFAPGFPAYVGSVAVLMAAEGVLTVVLRTLRSRLIPADAFGSTLAVTIILVLLPLPVAGALVAAVPAADIQHLLLACAVLQGLVLGACFAKLRSRLPTSPPAPVAAENR